MTVTAPLSRVEQGAGRRPDIQGLRAVAVLMVMAYHAGLPLYGGFTGVDVFFVISGFVITSVLLRELRDGDAVSLRRFYLRRVRRLLPALALVLTVTGIAGVVLLSLQAQRVTGRTGVAASLLVANVEIMQSSGGYFTTQAEDNALLHTWSLSVEEQFYLLFPMLLLLGWRLRRFGKGGEAGAAGVTLVVLIASFALSWYLSQGLALPGIDDPREFAFFSSTTRAWQFAAGALVALGWVKVQPLRGRLPPWARSALLTLGAALLAVAGFLVRGDGFPGLAALVPTLGAILVILTADCSGSLLARLLSSRPMVWIGGLSYSLYFWHWPVLVLGLGVVGSDGLAPRLLLVVASVLPAYASYRWVEQPIRGRSQMSGRQVIALVTVCLAVPIAVCSLLVVGASRSWGDEQVARWEALRVETPIGRQNGCHARGGRGGADLADCTFGTGERGVVMVVGDSHADALGDSVLSAADAAGYRTLIRTANGCPFLSDGDEWHGFRSRELVADCLAARERVWDEIGQVRPALVVVANRSPWYVERLGGHPDDPATVRAWAEAMRQTLDRLAASNIPTLVVHTVPEHRTSLDDCAHAWGIDESCTDIERAYPDAIRASTIAAEQDVVAEFPRHAGWDAAEALCDDVTCVRQVDGVPVYLDANHVNPSARQVLAGPLQQAMEALLD